MLYKREKYLNKISQKIKKMDEILFLVGARQVGKTTLLKSLIKFGYIDKNDFLWIDGDKITIKINSYDEFLTFLNLKYDLKKLKYLIIDEVHFIENIWIYLKNLIDDIRNDKFSFKIICSGSGSLNVFKWISDNLTWRYETIYVYGFDFLEFLEIKGLNIKNLKLENISSFVLEQIRPYFEEYLKFGSYPWVILSTTKKEKKEKFNQIIEDYFFKDVKLLLSKSEFIDFKNNLKLLAEKVWSIFSVSKFINEAWMTKYSFDKLKFILENTFILKFVEPFVGWKDSFEIKKANKLYFYDVGIWRYFVWLDDWVWEFKWKAVENFVFQNVVSNMENYYEIKFWQRRNETEIDFILYDKIDKKLDLIEVKSWKKDNIPKAIKSFLQRYGQNINKIVITKQWAFEKRDLEGKEVLFVPYEFVGKLKFD